MNPVDLGGLEETLQILHPHEHSNREKPLGSFQAQSQITIPQHDLLFVKESEAVDPRAPDQDGQPSGVPSSPSTRGR